jgi:hypothetical protein
VIGLVAFGHIQLRYDDVRLFGFAALAGTWGATFSILTSLKKRIAENSLDDLKLVVPWVTSILYFFVRSGLLGGTAFPDLLVSQGREAPAAGQTNATSAEKGSAVPPGTPLPNKLFAFLVVWCFIAGFSEKFVPGLLQKTESRTDEAERSEGDRFRLSGDGAKSPAPGRQFSERSGGPAGAPAAGG